MISGGIKVNYLEKFGDDTKYIMKMLPLNSIFSSILGKQKNKNKKNITNPNNN